ncbi:MAG: arginine repressor [Actinomycetales bacterium]|nr:arginine repressor [Actinomycetales bacterium]
MSGSGGTPRTATARRARIASLIATHAVGSQEELGHLLAEEGVSVTQATLSRDLVALGAMKVTDDDGSHHYVVDDVASGDTSLPLTGQEGALARLSGELLVRAEAAGNIAVLHTPPGAAQFFAGHLDRSTAFDTVGTVAGDDTVIIVMRSPGEAADLCAALLRMADQRRAL